MKTLLHWFRLLFVERTNPFESDNYYVLYPNGQKSQYFSLTQANIEINIFGGEVIKVTKKGRVK
jgi:hypothetical protein